jgi:hypothetical protein
MNYLPSFLKGPSSRSTAATAAAASAKPAAAAHTNAAATKGMRQRGVVQIDDATAAVAVASGDDDDDDDYGGGGNDLIVRAESDIAASNMSGPDSLDFAFYTFLRIMNDIAETGGDTDGHTLRNLLMALGAECRRALHAHHRTIISARPRAFDLATVTISTVYTGLDVLLTEIKTEWATAHDTIDKELDHLDLAHALCVVGMALCDKNH